MIELPDGTTIMNFDMDEFVCKCGCGLYNMDMGFLASLDYARDEAVTPFILTSGCRCETYNKLVGGKPTSSHLEGWAVDIAAVSAMHRYKIIDGLISAGITRRGYGKTFIHADSDPKKNPKRIWIY